MSEQGRGDPECALLAGAIRMLSYRLRCPDTLKDPQVSAALVQFERRLADVLGPGSGRHRLPAPADAVYGPEQVRAAWGFDYKPNPRTATTSQELVAAMRQYRAWSGNTPFRQMAAQARHAVAYSTMCVALNRHDLPALKVVQAIIVGCGGSAEDLEAFTAAWRRINAAVPRS